MKKLLLATLLMVATAFGADHTGVIDDSGNLLRSGFVPTNAWSTSSNETVVTSVPRPSKVYDIYNTNGWHRFETNTWFIFNPPMTNRIADWNDSKTNHQHIVDWENASVFRLGQLNTILTFEGVITNDLAFATLLDTTVADLVRIAGPTSASLSVSIALEECVKYTEKWVLELIGLPPDKSKISTHIKQH